MPKYCVDCRYIEKDYVWCEEVQDEYEIFSCSKRHDTEEIKDCDDYRKYTPKKYKEKRTKCDNCYFLQDCIDSEIVIDCTLVEDTTNHYICGNCCECKLKGDDNSI